MRILVAGASGFIGSRLVRALTAQGHHVVGASRSREPHSPLWAFVRVDFAQVPEPGWWMPQLQGIDVVINAVGIFRESGSQTFDALHHRAPVALFTACALAHVPTVIQVSALGTLVASRTIAFVGPAPLTLRHYLAELRLALGLAPPAVVLELPGRLCLALACVAGRLPPAGKFRGPRRGEHAAHEPVGGAGLDLDRPCLAGPVPGGRQPAVAG